MIITRATLGTYAIKTLDATAKAGIFSVEQAFHSHGTTLRPKDENVDTIGIHLRPSNFETSALKITYEIRDQERRIVTLPLELVLNRDLNYRMIIAKCNEPIPGYSVFGIDDYRNLAQSKKRERGAYWGELIEDVKSLILPQPKTQLNMMQRQQKQSRSASLPDI